MTDAKNNIEITDESGDKYKYGFVTEIEADTVPLGLNSEIIRLISKKKEEPEWLLQKRLQAFEFWQNNMNQEQNCCYFDKILKC